MKNLRMKRKQKRKKNNRCQIRVKKEGKQCRFCLPVSPPLCYKGVVANNPWRQQC
jgi:hypothetical protein